MEKLLEEYKKNQNTYFNKHWLDLLITGGIFAAVFGGLTYTTYQSTLAAIRNDWANNKCSPIILPFAGLIMPVPGQSTLDATVQNFEYCVQQDVSVVLQLLMLPLEFIAYAVIDFIEIILDAIAAIMAMLAALKAAIGGIAETAYEQIARFVLPIFLFILRVRDLISKANGVMMTSLYSTMVVYDIMVSGLINVVNVVYDLLVAMIVVVVALLTLAIALIPTPLVVEGIALFAAGTVALKFIVQIIGMYALLRTFILQAFNASTRDAPKAPNPKKKKK